MPTLWFSYSLGGGSLDGVEAINSPYSITWNVGRMLRERASERGYEFRYVNLDSVEPVEFSPGDVAIGHVWDTPGSFMQQALDAPIKAKIVLQPYSHGMVSAGDVSRYLGMFLKADALLFITGEYWFNTMEQSPYAALKPKATRVDMAVNTDLHPYLKTRWNAPGQRAVCCIGHDTPTKGYKHVAELARVAGFRLGHFGGAQPETFQQVPCFVNHGGQMFNREMIARICEDYDALLVIPEADANPTVILEAASWGLRVYASQESGYDTGSGMVLPLRKNDMAFNVGMMRAFQREDEYTLRTDSEFQRLRVERDYTWSKFCHTIWSKVSEVL